MAITTWEWWQVGGPLLHSVVVPAVLITPLPVATSHYCWAVDLEFNISIPHIKVTLLQPLVLSGRVRK